MDNAARERGTTSCVSPYGRTLTEAVLKSAAPGQPVATMPL